MNMVSKLFLLVAAVAISIAGISAFVPNNQKTVDGITADVENTGFALIELFTSEGCSSCPSADNLVSKISRESAGKPIYILAFHVDYWNRLGWKDPYSSAEYSKRQSQYASWFKLGSIYTPQIVVNGKTEFVGSNESRLRKAIVTGLQTPAQEMDLQITRLDKGKAEIQIDSEPKNNTGLYIAVVQKAAKTNVERGENQGRKLSHVNVVRSLQRINLNSRSQASITLPLNYNSHEWELIGFVQNSQNGEILSAGIGHKN